MYIFLYFCIYIFIYLYIYISVYFYKYIYIYNFILYTYMFIYLYISIFIYFCIHVCVYIYIQKVQAGSRLKALSLFEVTPCSYTLTTSRLPRAMLLSPVRGELPHGEACHPSGCPGPWPTDCSSHLFRVLSHQALNPKP